MLSFYMKLRNILFLDLKTRNFERGKLAIGSHELCTHRYWNVHLIIGKSHHDPIYETIMMENMGVAKLKMLIPLVARKTFWNSGTVYRLYSNVTIMCRNDELSLTMSWVGCLLTDFGLPDTWKLWQWEWQKFEKDLAISCK